MSNPEFNAIDRLTTKKITQPRNTSLVQMASVQNSSIDSSSILSPVSASPQNLPSPVDISAGMLRIETPINADIQALCTNKKISRDTFVEAAWIVLSKNTSVLDDVVKEAQERYKKRKAKGNAKRAKSMDKYKDLE